jgi:hypothetical protein
MASACTAPGYGRKDVFTNAGLLSLHTDTRQGMRQLLLIPVEQKTGSQARAERSLMAWTCLRDESCPT